MGEQHDWKQDKGEKNLRELLKSMKPKLNEGDYVFCTLQHDSQIDLNQVICSFQEQEGLTVILKKDKADQFKLNYNAVFSWITLTVHSALDAVGFTSAFSKALSEAGIGCNVIAAYFHDHIFILKKDAENAMKILGNISNLHGSF